MMQSGYLLFALKTFEDQDQILSNIRAVFPLGEEEVSVVDEEYFDTFDWRMFTNNLLFRRNETRYSIIPLAAAQAGAEISGPVQKRLFWWDFPEGEIQDKLKSVLGVRALCPLFRVMGRRRSLQLRNRDDKTVLRIFLDAGEVQATGEKQMTFPPLLSLVGVRGYRKPFHRVAEMLKADGVTAVEEGIFWAFLLGMIGRKPGDYSSKFSIILKPEQTLNQAISDIGLKLHQSMVINLPGVLDDIDPEFLHDFRVAVRRTRSALSQLKKAIPPGQRSVFSKEFKWLGSVTGPVRDMDVCLKKGEAFRAMLPEGLHPGLELMLEEIRRKRIAELTKMQENLRSERTAALLANWHEFLLALPKDIQWPGREISSLDAARKVIAKCFKRLARDAELIVDGEECDSAMHKLRIQGKKFRYLMEFFRTLFPEDATNRLLKDMKAMQDDLGDFNDLVVQIGKFQKDLEAVSPNKGQIKDSLTGLISGLKAKKKQLRKKCLRRCKKFRDWDKKTLLCEILGQKTG